MGQITDYMTSLESKGLWLEPLNDSRSIGVGDASLHRNQFFVNLGSSFRQP